MLNLRINSISPSGPDPSGIYYYNFTTPPPNYPNNEWPFTVLNSNAGFNVTGLNLTAATWFTQQVRDVSVDIEADGVPEWTHPGQMNSAEMVSGLESILSLALRNTAPVCDSYDNPMCALKINFSAYGGGTVGVSGLSIEYEYSATVQNFTGILKSLLAGKPNGTVQIPIEARASSPGRLRLSDLKITIDSPPVIDSDIPNFIIPEEGANLSLRDISAHFSDDFDSRLNFSIVENSNASNVNVSLNGTVLGARSLVTNWTGRTYVVIEASDHNGLTVRSNRFIVLVENVNDAPIITSTPPASVEVGRNLTYNVSAFDGDNDVLYYTVETDSSDVMTITRNTGILTWKATPPVNRTINVTINVSDLRTTATQKFSLRVTSNNTAPRIIRTAVASAFAGKPYFCNITAEDPDVSDTLTFSLFNPPSGMNISAVDARTAQITWRSPVEGNGTWKVIVNVTDDIAGDSFTFSLSVTKYVAPHINNSNLPKSVVAGDKLRVQIAATHMPGTAVNFTLEQGPAGMNISSSGLLTWSPKEDQKGTHHVVISVNDTMGTETTSFDIEVTQRSTIPLGIDLWIWMLIILIVAVAAAGGAGWYIVKSRESKIKQRWPVMPPRKEEPRPAPAPQSPKVVSQEKPAHSAGTAAPAEKGAQTPAMAAALTPAQKAAIVMPPLPQEKPAEAVASGPGTRVQDIFIIYRDGRLIHHLTNRLTPLDHEIFASMFSSVQDFMQDSMGAQKIDGIKFEEYNILMEKGKYINLAVVLSGDEPPEMRQTIKTAIADIELVCARLLEKWDGEAAPLKRDLELLLKPISELAKASKAEKKAKKNPEEYVTILSGVEFQRGYVRLKMEVKNDLDNVITDCSIKLIVKPDALRISHIEPGLHTLDGENIVIGNVQPAEKIAFALFLDPMVCAASFIDATLTFKDAKGQLYSIVMPRRRAEVVCPSFHTDDDVNIPILKKMITEFQQHDSKVYGIPEGLWAEEAFRMGMSVIEAHNVKLIREFTETKPAFAAEAWYYGRTQIKKDQVVMRISVSRDTNTLEFFVGSSDLAAITGLLAEFGHELNRRLKNKGIIQQNIKHLDLTEKDRLARKSQLLLHRYAEAEAGVAENEPKK